MVNYFSISFDLINPTMVLCGIINGNSSAFPKHCRILFLEILVFTVYTSNMQKVKSIVKDMLNL